MQRISYSEAVGPLDGNADRRLLENIAAGHFWFRAEDFNGRRFDSPEVQRAKAGVILQELDAQIAQLTDTDKQVEVMLLLLEATGKFREAVTKPRQPEPDTQKPEPAKPESEMSGEEKLKAAKALVRSGL